MSIFSRKVPAPPDWWVDNLKLSFGILDNDKKETSMKLKIGSYYPFVMKNGQGFHKCVGWVCKSGISVTNMNYFYQKEDILWAGDEIVIHFPEEYTKPEYL